MMTTDTAEILLQAERHEKDGNFDKAIQGFQHYLMTEPDSLQGWKGLFRSLCNRGRYEEAEHAAHRLVSLEPTNGRHFYDLATALRHNKNYLAARQAINRSIALDAECPLNYILAHLIYKDMEDNTTALEVLKFALTKFPHDARIYATLGMYAEERNLPEEALDYLQSAWLLNHLGLKHLGRIGDLLFTLGRVDEARKVWEKIASQDSIVQSAKDKLGKYKST